MKQEIDGLNATLHNANFQVVSASMGTLSQSDVEMARDCKGMMVCFNAKIPSKIVMLIILIMLN